MIDWAQLAQRSSERHRLCSNDGEKLLMKYGREVCYKPRRKSKASVK